MEKIIKYLSKYLYKNFFPLFTSYRFYGVHISGLILSLKARKRIKYMMTVSVAKTFEYYFALRVINKSCSRDKASNDKVTMSINKKCNTYQAMPQRRDGRRNVALLYLRAARKIRAWKPKIESVFFDTPTFKKPVISL